MVANDNWLNGYLFANNLNSQHPAPPKDLFSAQSKEYASSRPTYPQALIEFIIGLVKDKQLAWDCATGNGQAAIMLAGHFNKVIASDISARQIENAIKKDNVEYRIFPAENTPLDDNSVDLITVAQALHWFDFDRFYYEAKRVLKLRKKEGNASGCGGVIAAWAYGLHTISPEIDKISYHLYEDILGDKYWPAERKYVEERYETIPFPFDPISSPERLQIHLEWTMPELIKYFRSWSSVQKFIEKNRLDPVNEVRDALEKAWGGKNHINEKKIVVWPLYVKVGTNPE